MKKCVQKFMLGNYKAYLNSSDYDLEDVYYNYSSKKDNAMAYCKRVMKEYQGFSGRIISHNVMQFTYGFIGYYQGVLSFFYITKSYDRVISLEELEYLEGLYN